MLHTPRFYLQNTVYFIMLPFLVLYYSHFTYRVCQNLNVKLRCQKVKYIISLHSSGWGQEQATGYYQHSGFGGLQVACWPLVPKFAGSHPAEAVGFLVQKKILCTPSFGGEVKPSVPCRSFTACKRSLNVKCKSAFRQNSRTFLAHSFTFPPLGALAWGKLESLTKDRTISLKRLQCLVENKQTLSTL